MHLLTFKQCPTQRPFAPKSRDLLIWRTQPSTHPGWSERPSRSPQFNRKCWPWPLGGLEETSHHLGWDCPASFKAASEDREMPWSKPYPGYLHRYQFKRPCRHGLLNKFSSILLVVSFQNIRFVGLNTWLFLLSLLYFNIIVCRVQGHVRPLLRTWRSGTPKLPKPQKWESHGRSG